MRTLESRVAVITGASSGIGRAIAEALARRGARLCLVGRNVETLEPVARAARNDGGEATCHQADLSVAADVDRLVAGLAAAHASIDMLVHSAGVFRRGAFVQAPADHLDEQYRTNVRAPYVLTQGLLPALAAARGQVVFVNSTAGLAARANVAQYAASKHALKALADSLREEVNPLGVRVLSLHLGRTATAMQAAIHGMEGKAYQPDRLIQPEDVAAVAVHALELPRSVEITDVTLRPMAKPS